MIGSQVVDSGVLTLEPDRSRRRSSIGTPRLSETSRRPASAGKGGSASSRPVPGRCLRAPEWGCCTFVCRPRGAEPRNHAKKTTRRKARRRSHVRRPPSATVGARQQIVTIGKKSQNPNGKSDPLCEGLVLPCAARPGASESAVEKARPGRRPERRPHRERALRRPGTGGGPGRAHSQSPVARPVGE